MTNTYERRTHHRAGDLVEDFRESLVGRVVDTEALGLWEGGRCEVIEIAPDPAAPEIVFNVRRLEDGEEVGVFDYEAVALVESS